MARPQKEGLEYFPIVTIFDEKIELIIAEFGPEGLGIIIGLYQRIYFNGYFINWNDDTLMLFAKNINAEITKVNAVIMKCCARNIFNQDLYNQYGILTSTGIQKQFLKICKGSRRKSVQFIKEYCLIKPADELYSIITELIGVNAEETPENDGESTQRKEKEKEKKSKEKHTGVSAAETLSNSQEAIKLISYYEQLSPGESIAAHFNILNQWVEDYGYEWSREAINLCVSRKKTFIKAWIETVLKNWKTEGKDDNDGTGTYGERCADDPDKDRASPYDFSKYA